MQPPQDILEQRETAWQALARTGGVESDPQPDPEQVMLQHHAFEMVRSPLWEHLRDRARMEVPHMLAGYRDNLQHLALARMGVSAVIRYVEDLAAAHQETQR